MMTKILLPFLALFLMFGSPADSQRKSARRTSPTAKNAKTADTAAAPSRAGIKADYGKYDFSYTTLDGKALRLSDHAGKVVLVNIWAPWCGPCVRETPGFVKLYEKFKPQGFEILGVAVSTNEKDVRAFMSKYSPAWPVGIRDSVALSYGTNGIPDNYLFGSDGSLIKRFVGYTREEELQPLIESAIKQVAVSKTK
jgi:thiol-disulfide isomerase/thioredoxin